MHQRNIKYVHVCGIENVLLKIADPMFTGFCVETQTKCAAKIVDKLRYNEPINNICYMKNKQIRIVDFGLNSDLSTQILFDSKQENSLFSLGDICSYFFDVSFLETLCK